jgi:hypothetical protein
MLSLIITMIIAYYQVLASDGIWDVVSDQDAVTLGIRPQKYSFFFLGYSVGPRGRDVIYRQVLKSTLYYDFLVQIYSQC